MAQKDFEGLPRIDGRKRLQYFIVEIDVSFKGHFKSKAVRECDIFPDGFEESRVLWRYYGLGGEA